MAAWLARSLSFESFPIICKHNHSSKAHNMLNLKLVPVQQIAMCRRAYGPRLEAMYRVTSMCFFPCWVWLVSS